MTKVLYCPVDRWLYCLVWGLQTLPWARGPGWWKWLWAAVSLILGLFSGGAFVLLGAWKVAAGLLLPRHLLGRAFLVKLGPVFIPCRSPGPSEARVHSGTVGCTLRQVHLLFSGS